MPKATNALMQMRPDTTIAELVQMIMQEFGRTGNNACSFEIPGLEKRNGSHQPVKLGFEVRLHRVQ